MELLSAQNEIRYTSCSFSGDSQYFVAGLLNGHINAWVNKTATVQPFSLQLATMLCGSSDFVRQCMFDDENNLICSISNISETYNYQTLVNNPISETDEVHPHYANSCEFLTDEQLALTSGYGVICV